MIGNYLEKFSAASQSKDAEPQSRRRFLAGGAAAALTAVSAVASAQQLSKGGRRVRGGNTGTITFQGGSGGAGVTGSQVGGPGSAGGASRDPFAQYWSSSSLRLARRITYGLRYDELDAVSGMSFDDYLEQQLDYGSIDDSETINYLNSRYPHWKADVRASSDAGISWQAFMDPNIYYAAFSKRQLHARVVEFWLDHFYVNEEKARAFRMNEYVYSRIHPLAFTNFRAILGAVAKSPAMIMYLDNEKNRKDKPNINYARELLELHTVSSTGGYTEEDINEAAKMMTGWRIVWESYRADFTQVIFTDHMHEPGSKTVLGRTFEGVGADEFNQLLDFLDSLRATHDFICKKMYAFFIGREPSRAELDSYHAVWEATDGSVKDLLRNVLTEQNIMTAPSMYKQPFHFYVGILRQFNLKNAHIATLYYRYLRESGQVPFGWADPDGYPQSGDYWYNGHLIRLQHVMKLSAQNDVAIKYDGANLFPSRGTTSEFVEALNRNLFYGELPVPEKIWIHRHLRGKSLSIRNVRGAVAVALGSPSYQWY